MTRDNFLAKLHARRVITVKQRHLVSIAALESEGVFLNNLADVLISRRKHMTENYAKAVNGIVKKHERIKEDAS